jgi:light-regulated signal transduction histidine kinase (bacteriophytochrome)
MQKYSHGHTDSSSTVIYNEDSFEPPGNEEQDVAEHRKVTERSKFLFLNSGPVNVLPGSTRGSDGTPYRRCEDEPIHMPGAIQSYGALLGLKYSPHGHLEVRVASENTRKILGYGPEQLFTMPSFLDALRQDGRVELTARINHVLRAPDALKEETRLDVFQIYLTFPYEPEIRLWCAIHLAPSPANMVICEFEEYLDAFYLNDMRMAKTLPESPVRHMDHDVTPEEFEKSTTKAHKPLPVLEIARTRKNREFSSLDVFNAMSQAQQQISGCKSVQELMDVTVGIIAELTGFHRVMFYRFDAQKNGCVDAELLNPRACTDVFRG